MVFYFTGTGNSLYVARALDTEIISIPQIRKQERLEFTAEQIGIVCPIYGHEMPLMVKEFLKKATFHTEYFYFVLTYGARHGGAAELAEEYLKEIGKKADYITSIEMVDNFLPVFDMKEQMAQEKHIEEHIAQIKDDIANRRCRIQEVKEEDRETHRGYLKMVNNAPETIWAKFEVTEECVGCGLCTRACPAGCIRLENQHAVHTGEGCQACYACIHVCPKLAIRFQAPLTEKNDKARYRNPHVSLKELLQSNDQTALKESEG